MPCGPHGGASFLFINDLTNKATGVVLVVLIVLYVGHAAGLEPDDGQPARWIRPSALIMLMPLFFVVFIINFPAGVMSTGSRRTSGRWASST